MTMLNSKGPICIKYWNITLWEESVFLFWYSYYYVITDNTICIINWPMAVTVKKCITSQFYNTYWSYNFMQTENHGIFQRSFEINKNIPGLGPQKKYSFRATSAAEKACLSQMTLNWCMRKWNTELACCDRLAYKQVLLYNPNSFFLGGGVCLIIRMLMIGHFSTLNEFSCLPLYKNHYCIFFFFLYSLR